MNYHNSFKNKLLAGYCDDRKQKKSLKKIIFFSFSYRNAKKFLNLHFFPKKKFFHYVSSTCKQIDCSMKSKICTFFKIFSKTVVMYSYYTINKERQWSNIFHIFWFKNSSAFFFSTNYESFANKNKNKKFGGMIKRQLKIIAIIAAYHFEIYPFTNNSYTWLHNSTNIKFLLGI